MSDRRTVFEGDWRTLPRHCGGNVEVMDQTKPSGARPNLLRCTWCGSHHTLWVQLTPEMRAAELIAGVDAVREMIGIQADRVLLEEERALRDAADGLWEGMGLPKRARD